MKRYHFLFILFCVALLLSVAENIFAQKYHHPPTKTFLHEKKKKIKGTPKFISSPKYFYGTKNSSPEKVYYIQDFENQTFPPPEWALSNPDSNVTWVRSIEASGLGLGIASAFINFFDYSSPGETDSLFTPLLTGLQGNDTIKFDVAYGYYSGFNDSLRVLLSVNGGVTYSVLFNKGGDSLKTATTDEYFVPTAFQWKTWKIILPGTVTNATVKFAFVGINDYGNNLFLDNIRIGRKPSRDIGVKEVRPLPVPFLVNVPISIQVKLEWGGTGTPPQTTNATYKIDSAPVSQNDGHNQNFTTNWFGNPPVATVTFAIPYTPSTVGEKTIFVRSFYSLDSLAQNDIGSKSIIVTKTISTFPYEENFELEQSGWSRGTFTETNSWRLGKPNKDIITGAHSGIKCWVTKFNGDYNDLENSYVLSPIFDFSNWTASPVLSFFHNYQIEGGYDGGTLEYSTDGVNYTTLGVYADSTANHWFDVEDSVAFIASANWGYSSSDYDDNDSGWIQSAHRLEGLEGLSNVRFRFRFGSDDSNGDEGWAIDDIRISSPSDISGMKFEDKNGNGVKDGNESGLPHWKIFREGPLAFPDFSFDMDSVVTDSLGNYSFGDLLPGKVTLWEEKRDAWVQTFPPFSADSEQVHHFEMRGGDSVKNKNFGNVKLGNISGAVFFDVNANGVFDSLETTLAGWPVVLEGIKKDTMLTDADGKYAFENIQPGLYHLFQLPADGWIQTYPSGASYEIPMGLGQNFENKNFGNAEASSISGTKWNDKNGNGVKDSTEPGIANWKFFLTNGTSDSAFTDSNGIFKFNNLVAGHYFLNEQQIHGWFKSFPSVINYEIELGNKTDTSGFDFGNFQLATISGRIIEDNNQNGVLDSTEHSGIAGIKLLLSEAGTSTVTDTVVSNPNGFYEFVGLHEGSYVVAPFIDDTWDNTFPPNGEYEIALIAGQHSIGNNFGLFGFGSITGIVFEDVNANGIRESDEPPLQNWKIFLNETDTVVSSVGGEYYFNHLNAGEYTVTIEHPVPWHHSVPDSGNYEIDIVSRRYIEGKIFGNYLNGSIGGLSWNDKNGNGVFDSTEIPIGNWMIKLSGPHSDSTVTASDIGLYIFENIKPGLYVVSEIRQSGWVQTFPTGNGTHSFLLKSGAEITQKNFGNAETGRIVGYNFEDMNGDGIRNNDDHGIYQWIIRLSGNATRTALTDSSGKFEFKNIGPGVYVVSEQQQDGWMQTVPLNPNVYSLTLAGGETDSGRNFGNYKFGMISGKNFDDMNANGVQDSNEAGLADWKIKISGMKSDSIFTDAEGNFLFQGLRAGAYILSEVLLPEWVQTFPPAPGTHSLEMQSGKNISKNFGNRHPSGITITPGLPQGFALYQNYPNPFNPVTTVPFDVPRESQVSLAIYNILGQEIAVVLNKNFQAGKYNVSIDANQMKRGIYFYRLTAFDAEGKRFTSMKKMVVLK